MADLQGGGGDKKGGGEPQQHRRTMVEWIDRNQCAMHDSERTARAALYLHDAIDTRAPRHFSRGHLTVKAYSFFKSPAWSGLVLSAVVLHLLLALWEPPRRLPDSAPYHDSLNRHTLRSGHETAQHLLGLEAFLVMLYICDLLLEIFALGPAAFFSLGPPPRVVAGMGRSAAWASKTWSQVRFVLVLLFLLDVSGNINGGITTHFSRALRPLMLICVCDPLKRWSVLLVKILSQLRDVAISIAIVLALFALTGLVLFSETDYYQGGMRFQNFNNFFNSVVALYVLLTTQNFGDLLNPAYTADPRHSTPLYFFYFALFVVVLVLFMANLALPRVYWVFQSFQRAQAYQARTNERLALLLSFRCLDVEKRGYVDLSQFRDLLRYIRPEFFDHSSANKYERNAYAGATEHMFLELAKDHPARLYPANFFNICEVILMDFYPLGSSQRRAAEQQQADDSFPARHKTFLQTVFSSRWAELASMVLLLLTLFFLSFYGSPSIDKAQLRHFCYFVVVVFTIEVVLKLWAFGVTQFFRQAENTIDALVMGAAFMSLLVYGFSAPHSALHRSEQLANLCLLFLAFRGVRLFPKCDIFAKFQCAFKVLPFFFFSFALCLLLVYSWAAIGMACFSGLAARPKAHQFGAMAAVNNFESFWGASVTLFQVASTHEWSRTMYMWMDLSDTSWAALYFLPFHAVAHLVAVTLTTALFLDAFLSFDGKRWVEADDNSSSADVAAADPSGPLPSGPGTSDEPGGSSGEEFTAPTPRIVMPEAPEQPSEELHPHGAGGDAEQRADDVAARHTSSSRRESGRARSRNLQLPSYPHLPQQHANYDHGASISPVGAPTGQPHHHHRLSSGGYKAQVV